MRRGGSEEVSVDERYVPHHGDPSYTVLHYDLVVDYSPEGNRLTGTAVLATDALITIAVDIARSMIFGKLDLLDRSGVVLGGVIGLASLPGSWVASLLVRRLGHKLHIVIIETLIAVGGLSILIHGVRAL